MRFDEPRDFAPIELEAQIELLPTNARCKGIFFQDLLERVQKLEPGVDLLRAARLPSRRYLPVLDYPHADWMRLAAAAAVVQNRGGHPGRGLRTLGQHAYDAIFKSPVGRVLFGPLGFDVEQVVAHAGLGYRLGLNFGRIDAQRLGEGHYRVEFRDMPTFLETYNVGVIEGAVMHYQLVPRVKVAMDGWSRMTLDVRWD